jgi:hypothetical protein
MLLTLLLMCTTIKIDAKVLQKFWLQFDFSFKTFSNYMGIIFCRKQFNVPEIMSCNKLEVIWRSGDEWCLHLEM